MLILLSRKVNGRRVLLKQYHSHEQQSATFIRTVLSSGFGLGEENKQNQGIEIRQAKAHRSEGA